MRVLRAKAARKALHFYKVTHGIRDPYTLLVDGTFVHHALVGVKTNLASRVEKVLGRDVRYAVPGPVLDDLRNRGEAGAAALEFCRRRCRVIADTWDQEAFDADAAHRHRRADGKLVGTEVSRDENTGLCPCTAAAVVEQDTAAGISRADLYKRRQLECSDRWYRTCENRAHDYQYRSPHRHVDHSLPPTCTVAWLMIRNAESMPARSS